MSATTTGSDNFINLDGCSLTTKDLINIGYNDYKVRITPEVETAIQKARDVVDRVLASDKVVYGINTGCGSLSSVKISSDQLKQTQQNIIRSHAVGVGPNLTAARTKMLLALRINVLTKGYSGISLQTVKRAIDILNAGCLPLIPEKGTLGASGDLAPLSHLAQGLMGEGPMLDCSTQMVGNAGDILAAHQLQPVELKAKEGVALINGTQLIASLGAEALQRSKLIVETADVIAAMSLEVLRGTTTPLHPAVHEARPHAGQKACAAFLRSILQGSKSEINESHQNCGGVQDSYTLRCIPQVHGIVRDTLDFAERVLTTEYNSATDNPMVLPDLDMTVSGGNFHGEYPAKVLDYLAIAVHELSSISERRIERLINDQLSNGLPGFLVKELGLNSGYMIAHYTAAALVSENKSLCHPASVDSISTSAAKEDHVSMGGWAARKALVVLDNVENVLAIELLANVQALDFLRPLKTTKPLEAVHALVRSKVSFMVRDRFIRPDIDAVNELITTGQVLKVVKDCLEQLKIDSLDNMHL